MSRIVPNPFSDDVFVDRDDHLPGVVEIHGETFTRLIETIEWAADGDKDRTGAPLSGRTFLLTAPRAGYGKSHLVARLRSRTEEFAHTMTLPFSPEQPTSWRNTFDALLDQAETEDEGGWLRNIGRHYLALMIRFALDADRIEQAHFPTDTSRLREDHENLFDLERNDNIVHWTCEHCDRLVEDPGSVHGADARFWARLFLDLELGDDDVVRRLRNLEEGPSRSRCLQFLRIAAAFRPLILIVDDLDGFFSSETAGLQIAHIVTGIRDGVPRSFSVVCLNDDLWESVFSGRLPSAYLDRLTGETERLEPISTKTAEALVVHRLQRIDLAEEEARKFAVRVSNTGGWIDSQRFLTPREVLRQARTLWDKVGAGYLAEDYEDISRDPSPVYDVPLSELTDKPNFFAALKKNGLDHQEKTRKEGAAEQAASPSGKKNEPEPAEEDEPINPFFAPEPPVREPLDGIESIIRDIRGSGSSVTTEPVSRKEQGKTRPVPTIKAGTLALTPKSGEETRPGAAKNTSSGKESPIPVSRESIDRRIHEKHRSLLGGLPLRLDLPRLGKFLRAVGCNHPGLNQVEEHLPGAQSTCLRWRIRGHSVLLGFESPKNVYFWNHLLQKTLSSTEREKISAFSHESEEFDSDMFASFGFSPAVIRGRIDPIEMSDEELALLYAADSVLEEFRGTDEEAMAMQHITQQLDPLWRRIGQAV